MRFGTKQDVPFIIAVIRDGMRDGYFNFDDDDGIVSVRKSRSSEAIARRERGENCADFLFVFDAQHNGAAIGFALLTGKNGANGLASHLEIRMFGVTRSQRQKDLGAPCCKVFWMLLPAIKWRHPVFLHQLSWPGC